MKFPLVCISTMVGRLLEILPLNSLYVGSLYKGCTVCNVQCPNVPILFLCVQVKYRIAVGLSKEGWAITRNFITLVIMISMGIVFFNYMLKEFCIIALVGLICDTFLQLVLFPTVLCIDLRRLEVCRGVCGDCLVVFRRMVITK